MEKSSEMIQEEHGQPKKSVRIKKCLAARFFGLIGTLILLAVILFFAPTAVLPLFHIQIFEVITGSMEPTLPVGSMVLVQEILGEDIEEGDVITFSGGGLSKEAIVTHRVVKKTEEEHSFITKGDANDSEDPYPVKYDQVMGKIIWSFPLLGGVYRFFSTMMGKIAALGGIFLGMGFLSLETSVQKAYRKKQKKRQRENSASK